MPDENQANEVYQNVRRLLAEGFYEPEEGEVPVIRFVGVDPGFRSSRVTELYLSADDTIAMANRSFSWQGQLSEEGRRILFGLDVQEHGGVDYNDNRETDERGTEMPADPTPTETAWDNLTNGQMVVIDEHFGTPAPQWIREHASTVGYIHDNRDRNAFYRSLWSGLRRYNSLTAPQYTAVQNDRRRAMTTTVSGTPTPAVGWAMQDDLPYIYNGKYSIEHEGEHVTIKVHTVREGGMQGQRIVKRAVDTYGNFRGFGTILQDGSLYLWRSQSALEGSKVVEFTKVLLRSMVAAHNAGSEIIWSAQGDGENHRASVVIGGAHYDLWLARRCRRCNRELTNPQSVQDGIGPECSQRDTAADRSVAANQLTHVNDPGGHQRRAAADDPAASRTRRTVSSAASRRAATPTYGQAREAHAASTVAAAMLSELGSGELL